MDCHRACLQERGLSWHRRMEGEGRRLQAEYVPADASAVEGFPRTLSSWGLMIVLTLVKVCVCSCVRAHLPAESRGRRSYRWWWWGYKLPSMDAGNCS